MREIIVDYDKENTVALIENGKIIERYVEKEEEKRIEGNIYLGIVEDVLPGMQAAFVNIGEGKNAFMHIKDVIKKVSNKTGNINEDLNKYDITKIIKKGTPLVVQVKKDCTEKKGARVSVNLNIPGRFVVLMPEVDFITVSQKIENEKEKERLNKIVKEVIPKGFGAIIRTSAIDVDKKDIQEDIKELLDLYNKMQKDSKDKKQPQLLYKAPDIQIKFIIDLIYNDIDRILINNKEKYDEIVKSIKNVKNVKIEYRKEDLLDLYGLHEQIEKIDNRKIWLKCGGFITIDKTEALTAIDVNTGKYTGKKDLEETVKKVNLEATIEIAKQLRLRDIGGIIIIDYIDMQKDETRKIIIDALEESLKKDRAKTQVVGFTKLDLLELTRKHICSN